jgi:hypothetical protein
MKQACKEEAYKEEITERPEMEGGVIEVSKTSSQVRFVPLLGVIFTGVPSLTNAWPWAEAKFPILVTDNFVVVGVFI